jgi:hypothetical protein
VLGLAEVLAGYDPARFRRVAAVTVIVVTDAGFLGRTADPQANIDIKEVAFPVPDAARRSNNWDTRMVVDVSGDVFSSGFAFQVCTCRTYSLYVAALRHAALVRRSSQLFDFLANAVYTSASIPTLDFRVLSFECSMERESPSATSLLVSLVVVLLQSNCMPRRYLHLTVMCAANAAHAH